MVHGVGSRGVLVAILLSVVGVRIKGCLFQGIECSLLQQILGFRLDVSVVEVPLSLKRWGDLRGLNILLRKLGIYSLLSSRLGERHFVKY